jgi:hypothetical protein
MLPSPWLNQFTLRLLLLVKEAITLALNNHVLHNHTTSHHLLYGLVAPCSSRVSNNSPPTLEHTKWLLHILPTCLFFCEHLTFLFFKAMDCHHKCRPPEIYVIGQIVPLVILVVIVLVANLLGIAFYKPREYWRALEHVNFIVRTCHVKKSAKPKYFCDPTASTAMWQLTVISNNLDLVLLW